MTLRCISLHQPWASLVAARFKTIETRSWPTKVRGRIAIHAAVRPFGINSAQADVVRSMPLIDYRYLGQFLGHGDVEESLAYPLGAIVATAELVGCLPMGMAGRYSPGDTDYYERHVLLDGLHGHLWLWDGTTSIDIEDQRPYGDFTPGRWAWLLEDIKPTVERCPACWGEGGFKEDSMLLYGIPGGEDWVSECSACKGRGRCRPVPARGRQGWWRWQP